MYPFLRLATTLLRARNMPAMDILDTHVSRHRVRLNDCDMFAEMNNGRILTLYEFGRFEAGVRVGLLKALKKNGWGLTVAGSSIRYRRRLLPLERYEQRSRIIHWDERFVHIEQGMFKQNGDCASHLLIRTAVVGNGKAIPTEKVLAALGEPDRASPAAPEWAAAWMQAEAQRPWPPMVDVS